MVSTPLKNISQNGNLPHIGVKIKQYLKPPPSLYPANLLKVTLLFGTYISWKMIQDARGESRETELLVKTPTWNGCTNNIQQLFATYALNLLKWKIWGDYSCKIWGKLWTFPIPLGFIWGLEIGFQGPQFFFKHNQDLVWNMGPSSFREATVGIHGSTSLPSASVLGKEKIPPTSMNFMGGL